MPTKQELIRSLDKPHYNVMEVKGLINSVKETRTIISSIKKGDVFVDFIGVKSRPAVVFKIVGDIVFAIPFTSTNNEFALYPAKRSRFTLPEIGDTFFSRTLVTTTQKHVKENFVHTYEHIKELNIAVSLLKIFTSKAFTK